MKPPFDKRKRLNFVDALRGLSAIGVLFWHYQHFYYASAAQPVIWFEKSQQPFFAYFSFLFLHGSIGVYIFWVISGFVFAHVYVAAENQTGAYAFWTRRIARLYPLHLATLLLVAALQLTSMQLAGHFQIYPFNDLRHFVLQLFMASHWGLEQGFSFNAPIWSVSVEILIYGFFFLTLSTHRNLGIMAPVTFVAFLVAAQFAGYGSVLACGACFFGGCVMYQVWNQLILSRAWAGVALLVISVAVLAYGCTRPSLDTAEIYLIAFSSVAAAACLDSFGLRLPKQIGCLGDISYSSYLIHIPIQITVLIMIDLAVFDMSAVTHGWFLIGYLVVVLVGAYIVHGLFEMPAQRCVRSLAARRTTNAERPSAALSVPDDSGRARPAKAPR